MVLLQASHCSRNSEVRAYTLQSTENVGVYLRDHALHCCQVFHDGSHIEDGTTQQAQVRLMLMLKFYMYLFNVHCGTVASSFVSLLGA